MKNLIIYIAFYQFEVVKVSAQNWFHQPLDHNNPENTTIWKQVFQK
jgi:hypothetical protein